jgi:hypothetical protein
MKRSIVVLTLAAAMMTASTAAFAGTQATNTNTVSPTLQISATIQKAVSLTLSTGATAGISHCAVVPTGGTPDYTMNFGNVDALGINTGNCNKFNPANPGVDNAVYWTDYTVTPVFTSHQAFAGTTVSAQVTTNFGAPNNVFIVRDSANSGTVPASAASFTALGVASADTISAAGTVSGTQLTRFIGVAVKPDNGATVLQGAQTATVTFTLTVQ